MVIFMDTLLVYICLNYPQLQFYSCSNCNKVPNFSFPLKIRHYPSLLLSSEFFSSPTQLIWFIIIDIISRQFVFRSRNFFFLRSRKFFFRSRKLFFRSRQFFLIFLMVFFIRAWLYITFNDGFFCLRYRCR